MTSKGFVLFTTILMLAMLTLLVLSLMQAVLLYVKAGNQLTKRHQAFYQLETAAHLLRFSHLAHQDAQCIVAEKLADQVIERLKHQHGCEKVIENQAYLYLIEDLGIEPCLQVIAHDVPFSTRHWRLTLGAEGENHDYLQIRVAELTGHRPCLNQQVLQIRPGLVSWRFWSVV